MCIRDRNGYDRYEQIIKKQFRKKYPVISSLYGQHTDTAEDIHISPIGFEGNPKEWYIAMQQIIKLFSIYAHGDIPLLGITLKACLLYTSRCV